MCLRWRTCRSLQVELSRGLGLGQWELRLRMFGNPKASGKIVLRHQVIRMRVDIQVFFLSSKQLTKTSGYHQHRSESVRTDACVQIRSAASPCRYKRGGPSTEPWRTPRLKEVGWVGRLSVVADVSIAKVRVGPQERVSRWVKAGEATVGGASLEASIHWKQSITKAQMCWQRYTSWGRCDSFRSLHDLHNSPAVSASSERLH